MDTWTDYAKTHGFEGREHLMNYAGAIGRNCAKRSSGLAQDSIQAALLALTELVAQGRTFESPVELGKAIAKEANALVWAERAYSKRRAAKAPEPSYGVDFDRIVDTIDYLDCLPNRQRRSVVKSMMGYTQDEIAAQEGRSRDTVKRDVAAALQEKTIKAKAFALPAIEAPTRALVGTKPVCPISAVSLTAMQKCPPHQVPAGASSQPRPRLKALT